MVDSGLDAFGTPATPIGMSTRWVKCGREFNQPTRKPLLPTAKVRRPLAQRAQMASVGQITELTLTGRSCTKGSKMAVQSARPGHDIHIIMEPGSREVRGPGMRASALVLWAHALAGRG